MMHSPKRRSVRDIGKTYEAIYSEKGTHCFNAKEFFDFALKNEHKYDLIKRGDDLFAPMAEGLSVPRITYKDLINDYLATVKNKKSMKGSVKLLIAFVIWIKIIILYKAYQDMNSWAGIIVIIWVVIMAVKVFLLFIKFFVETVLPWMVRNIVKGIDWFIKMADEHLTD